MPCRRMKALEPPDSLFVHTARKWLEMGNRVAAQQELDHVAPEFRSHPDVLEVTWAVEAQARNWKACLDLAQAIVTIAPQRPTGWIKRSFVLHRLKRTQEALNHLFPAAEKFSHIALSLTTWPAMPLNSVVCGKPNAGSSRLSKSEARNTGAWPCGSRI